jgi:AraC-like DNA-binding protein
MGTQLTPLCGLALRHASGDRMQTAIARVSLIVQSQPTMPQSGVFKPALCLVLQGAKEVTIGGQVLRYDPACYFVASLELPASARIVEASPQRPYVCVSLALDPETLGALLPKMPVMPEAQTSAFAVSPVTGEMIDAWSRLLGLLDAPQDIAVLAPLFEREILYRLLQGPHGIALRQIVRAGSRLSQVRRAIAWIKAHYSESMRIEDLADLAGMSAATFHRHFKAATAMSPLQYQKNLRLQEARRLLIANQDAARAGFAVGYESASQFSREYARLFGAPPSRDVLRLRGSRTDVAANLT